jgi:hypothetical protein
MAEAEFRKEFPNTTALLEDDNDANDKRFDAKDVYTAFVDGYLAGMLGVRDLMKTDRPEQSPLDHEESCQFSDTHGCTCGPE